MRGIFRKVDLDIHTDERTQRLSRPKPNAFDLFLYLLIAKESNPIPGVIPAGAGTIGDSLRWDASGVKKVFREIEDQGLAKADWDARLVWVPKAIIYNPPENPSVIRGWRKFWRLVPECELRSEIFEGLRTFVEAIANPSFLEAFREVFADQYPGAFAPTVQGHRPPPPSRDTVPPHPVPSPPLPTVTPDGGGTSGEQGSRGAGEEAFSEPPEKFLAGGGKASSEGGAVKTLPLPAKRPRTKSQQKPPAVRVVKLPPPEVYPPLSYDEQEISKPPPEKPPDPPPLAQPAVVLVADYVAAWNAAAQGTPLLEWESVERGQQKRLEALGAELDEWTEACRRVARNRYLRGEKPSGKKGLEPVDAGWLLNPKNYAAVRGGEYAIDLPEGRAAGPPEAEAENVCEKCGEPASGTRINGQMFCDPCFDARLAKVGRA